MVSLDEHHLHVLQNVYEHITRTMDIRELSLVSLFSQTCLSYTSCATCQYEPVAKNTFIIDDKVITHAFAMVDWLSCHSKRDSLGKPFETTFITSVVNMIITVPLS